MRKLFIWLELLEWVKQICFICKAYVKTLHYKEEEIPTVS